MSNDKPLPITLTGLYKGYQVAIQVEATLDSLDKLVNRLQARGIEPMPTPAGNGKARKPTETLECTVVEVLTSHAMKNGSGRILKLQVDDGEDDTRIVTAFPPLSGVMADRNVKRGDCLKLAGYTRKDERFGNQFIIQEFERIQQSA